MIQESDGAVKNKPGEKDKVINTVVASPSDDEDVSLVPQEVAGQDLATEADIDSLFPPTLFSPDIVKDSGAPKDVAAKERSKAKSTFIDETFFEGTKQTKDIDRGQKCPPPEVEDERVDDDDLDFDLLFPTEEFAQVQGDIAADKEVSDKPGQKTEPVSRKCLFPETDHSAQNNARIEEVELNDSLLGVDLCSSPDKPGQKTEPVSRKCLFPETDHPAQNNARTEEVELNDSLLGVDLCSSPEWDNQEVTTDKPEKSLCLPKLDSDDNETGKNIIVLDRTHLKSHLCAGIQFFPLFSFRL